MLSLMIKELRLFFGSPQNSDQDQLNRDSYIDQEYKKMKKYCILFCVMVLVFLFPYCGKNSQSDTPQPGEKNEKGEKSAGEQGKKGGEIDINSPEIPARLREAIKSGRIPKERVKEMLANMKNSGDAPTVQIEPAKRQLINAFLVLNGVVEPERKVEVYSRLSAYVKRIVREEGDEVKRDETLALLDDTEIQVSYKQAQIQLEQAKLTLQDEAINYKRGEELRDTKMISDQEFQIIQATYNKTKLDHLAKLENFKGLQLQLSYTKIKAPAEGYITARTIEVGTRVNMNQQVFTVEDFSPLLVKVFVPSSDIVNLKTGMETEVFTDALSGKIFNGNIKLINPRIDVQSGTIKVTIEVFDKTRQLKPGMFVETKILISNTPNALVVPKKSLNYKDNQAFVFVFSRESREVSKRLVKTGIAEKDVMEILDGLQEGERVVTVGTEILKDKMKVKILR